MKTDRRDADMLAQSYQSGDLTPVWVPTPEHQAFSAEDTNQTGASKQNFLVAGSFPINAFTVQRPPGHPVRLSRCGPAAP